MLFIDEVNKHFKKDPDFLKCVQEIYKHDPHTKVFICTQKLQNKDLELLQNKDLELYMNYIKSKD